MRVRDQSLEDYQRWKGWRSDQWGKFSEKKGAEFRKLLGCNPAGKSLLELGFGSGSFLSWASESGALVSGVEVQEALLLAAKEKKFRVARSLREASDWAPFDLICAFDVLEHLSVGEINAFFALASQWLSPGGLICVKVPNAACPFALGMQFGDVTHVTPLTRGSVGQLLSPHGLRIDRCRPHSAPLPGGFAGVRAILQRAIRHLYRKFAKFVWDLSEEHFYQCIVLEIRSAP
ncbi:MAG: class I SAM-dependent methyltransferase [Betaproteobacteria bacterium]|nr:class I SAM-dependent methyltransferase [Betaproteobacteria bacterium]